MEKYKSFYPTLKQAKTKWSSSSIVQKQGEGPSHDWFALLKHDKLARSAVLAKLGSISKQTKIVREDKIGKQTPSAEEIAKKHGVSLDQINAQIQKGKEVEKEHTDDEGMADEIARDHLGEFPDYYDRLGAMEKAAKKSVKEEVLIEAVGSNTKGVLHELLVGYHLRGGKHMEKHPDVNGDSPKQAHDKLKASIHPDEYKKINSRAKAAASDLASHLSKHGTVHDVHWTSKPGDLHRSTGIHATQKEDPSDIVVHMKKGSKITHHGRSLKVSDSKSGELPVSNPGMEHTFGGAKILAKHRAELIKKHGAIGKLTNKADRKAYLKSSPKVQKSVSEMNSKVLTKITSNMHAHLASMKTEDLAHHIRHNIIKAVQTPMEKAGAGHTHGRHTTYGTENHTFDYKQPHTDHDHILNDHKNISVRQAGNSVIFSHKKHGDFARHRIKFESQSDPLSIVKGSGELISSKKKKAMTEAVKSKLLKGYRMMQNDPPVPTSKTPSPVALKGYERVKDGKFNVLRKKQTVESTGWTPEKEQLRNRIAAHKDVAEKMARERGEQSQEASFHRALVKRWEKELDEDSLDEEAKPKKKKQTKKAWQAMAVLAKKSKDTGAVRKALRAHAALKEEVANSVGGGMSPVIGGEGNIHGTDPIMGKPIRRKKFGGKQVFVVDPTTYHKAYLGKRKNEHYEKYLEGSPMADEIREYGRKNWDESIVIENEQTGAMVYLKYGSK